MVQMFTSRAELLDKEETTADHKRSHQEEIEKLDKDKANADPYHGGLFGGLFKPKPPALKPIVDVDDGVARCPMCSWELEDDHTCGGCGWLYRPDTDESDLSESDFSVTDEYDSALEDEEGEEDDFGDVEAGNTMFAPYGPLNYGFPPMGMGPNWGQMRVPFPFSHPHHFPPPRPMGGIPLDDEDDYEDDEEDEYDDGDSFIDDDDGQNGHIHGAHYDSQSDRSTVINDSRPMNRPSSRAPPVIPHSSTAPPPYVPTHHEDWWSEAYGGPARSRPSTEGPSEEGSDISTDEDASDAEDSDVPHAGRSRPQVYQPTSPIAATDDESVPDDSSSPPRPMRSSRYTGSSAGNAITIDDSDEEQPVGPMRRTAQRRQARFSPY